MDELFVFIYCQPLSRIVLCMFLLVFLWAYIGHWERSSLRWRIGNLILFAGAVAVVFYMTVYTRGEGSGEAVLKPFQSFQEAKIQPELYRSMLMNVFLFVPLGLTLPFALGNGRLPELITILLSLVFSAGIEYMQYRYGLGWCEADDVIMNTLGAVLGVLAHCIFRNWERCILPLFQQTIKLLRYLIGKQKN